MARILIIEDEAVLARLYQTVLIRLGYAGKVASPHKGWASSSDVADFAEEHNSFTPADPKTDPWTQFVSKLRERPPDSGVP